MSEGILELRVLGKVTVATDICRLELAHPDGTLLPPFTAGAHVDIHLANGIARQYSLCNSPADRRRYVLAVLREPDSRGGSAAIHDIVQVGSSIRVGFPRNHFPLVQSARRSILLAGGIGITPIICMAEHLAEIGSDFEMHYCARSGARMAFGDSIRNSRYAGRASFHLDNGPVDQRLDFARTLASPNEGTHLYVCGPAGFIQASLGHARMHGWAEDNLHREFFAPAPAGQVRDEEFQIRIASTGETFPVARGQTAIDVLAKAGIAIPTSCEEGVCGTCLTQVLEGVPDHRDSFLTESERSANDRFIPCCSRAKSAMLVLKL